jgi:hypothetical protein
MKNFFKLVGILALLVVGMALMAFVPQNSGTGAVCEGYDYKIDVPGVYDGPEAYVEAYEDIATWTAKEGYTISGVCVKIGGPGGGSLILFGPGDGSYVAQKYGNSHVAFDVDPVEPTEEPTQEPTEEPTQEPTEEPTQEPTEEPTQEPTEEPTQEPTDEPTYCEVVEVIYGEWSDWMVDPDDNTQEYRERTITEVDAQDNTYICGEDVEREYRDIDEEPTEEPTQEPTEEPTDPPGDDEDDDVDLDGDLGGGTDPVLFVVFGGAGLVALVFIIAAIKGSAQKKSIS